jgi:hypothetical protein
MSQEINIPDHIIGLTDSELTVLEKHQVTMNRYKNNNINGG